MAYVQIGNASEKESRRRGSESNVGFLSEEGSVQDVPFEDVKFASDDPQMSASLLKSPASLKRWRITALVLMVLLVWTWGLVLVKVLETRKLSYLKPILSTTGATIDFPIGSIPNVFSPASVASKWESVVFHNNFHEDRTPYQGPPTDEVDKAWESLYKNIGVIKIPKTDADRLPNQTLPIPGEEDGYIVGIEVYHQLHCLDTIRQSLYPERYGGDSGMNEHQKAFYWIHLEHCVDNIRQVIMCYSDISTIPWKYHERVNGEFPDAHTTHVCRNFDALTEWMQHPDRSFPQEKYQARLNAYKASLGK